MNKLNFNRVTSTKIRKTGYGHWQVTMLVYRKPYSFITTNSSAIDDFKHRDEDHKIARAYNELRKECMRSYRNQVYKPNLK